MKNHLLGSDFCSFISSDTNFELETVSLDPSIKTYMTVWKNKINNARKNNNTKSKPPQWQRLKKTLLSKHLLLQR